MQFSLLSDGPTERHTWRAAGLAVGVHAAVIVAFLSGRHPPPQIATPFEQELGLVEDDAPAAPPAAPAVENERPSEPGAVAMAERPPARGDAFTEPRAPSTAPPEAAPAPVASNAPMTFYAPAGSAVIALGGTNPFLARGALPDAPSQGNGTSTRLGERPVEPKSNGEAKAAADGALRESLADRSAKGIGPEGPVLHALEDAAYGGLAPERGKATFVAIVDGRGFVTDLKLVASSPSDPAGWEDARKRALEALRGKKMPGMGSKEGGGAELRISVSSDVVYPSGTSAPVGLAQSAPGLSFDVSDIGAKKRRIVRASLSGVREM